MLDLCILFNHHECNETAYENFLILKEKNAGAKVIPIADALVPVLPDTVNVHNYPSRWNTHDLWRFADTIFYRWFLNCRVEAKHYALIEWDTYCNVSIKEACKEVWNLDIGCANFYTLKNNPNWYWFNNGELDRLSDEDRLYAAGIVPFGFILFSYEAAKKIVDEVTSNDVFSELRLGTTVNKLGLKVGLINKKFSKYLKCEVEHTNFSKPGLYHPKKSWVIMEKLLENRKMEIKNRRLIKRLIRFIKKFFSS